MRTTARHARNDHIVQLRARGLTIKKIAEEVGVSERHCARILDERKQTSTSSTKAPAQSSASSTATELLDRLQTRVGDIAAIARANCSPYDMRILRLEIMLGMAEQDIAELRRRSAQLVPADPIEKGGFPPFRDGHVMTRSVRMVSGR